MQLIDSTYFHSGDLLIEGLSDGVTPMATAMTLSVGRAIDVYGNEYLDHLLGKRMADDFRMFLLKRESGELTEDDYSELFEQLVFEFTSYGSVEKRSPIAYYVYYWYVRENQLRATPLGVTLANSDNRVVSPVAKLTTAWNRMADMSRDIACRVLRPAGHKEVGDMQIFYHINTLGIV